MSGDEAERLAGTSPTRLTGFALALVALLAIGVFLLHADYGITWDEGVQARYGELALDYFASGGKDAGVVDYYNLNYYGPIYEMVPAAIYRLFDLPPFETRHLVNGLLALLLVPGLLYLGRRLDGPPAGALAVVALLAMPRLVGHAFNNSKDVPLTVAVVFFMLASSRLLAERDFRWRWVLATAAAFGAALWARPGAFPLLAAWLVVARVAGLLLGRTPEPEIRDSRGVRPGIAGAAVLALGWALMVAPWPWAHANPAVHPIIGMSAAARFPTELPVLFGGDLYWLADVPRRYALEYLLITTPLGVLALATVGGFLALRRVVRGPRCQARATAALLLAWLLIPLVAVTALNPHLYDGIRHLLFVLPALALLAGLGGAWFIRRSPAGTARGLAAVAVALLLLTSLPSILRLHPYQTTYFNAFVGGTEGAEGRYELDYWASSYTEAMRWINREAAAAERPVRVLVGGSEFLKPVIRHLAGPRIDPIVADIEALRSPPPDDLDYYLALTRWGLEQYFSAAPVVYSVGRAGATFAIVKRLR